MSAARERPEDQIEGMRASGVSLRNAQDGSSDTAEGARPRVVYTQAPVQLGLLLGREEGQWRVRLGAQEMTIDADASVDPALLDEVARTGGRVLLDVHGEPTIVGAVLTRRALTIDEHGDVEADVRSFTIRATRQLLLQTGRAFAQLKGGRIELFGVRIVQRARERVRLLARQIGLN